MRIRLDTRASADAIVRFFRAHDYVVERREDTLVDVRPADARGEQADRERVVRDLEAWQAWNSQAGVELLD